MLSKLKKVFTGRAAKVIGVLLLIALLVFSALFYMNQNRNLTATEADNVLSEVRKLQQDKKYSEAGAKLQTFLNDKKMTDDLRGRLVFGLGTNYLLVKDYPKAIENFKKSAELEGSMTFTTAHSIADAAAAANQKDVAIEYYQKSIEIAKTNSDPYDNQSIGAYETTIKYLQGTNGQPNAKYNQIPEGVNVPKEFLQ